MGEKSNEKSNEKGGPKTFEELAAKAGMKTESVAKLVALDFDSTNAVKLMSDSDCTAVGLTLGQLRMLQKWRDTLCTPRTAGRRSQVPEASGGDENMALPPPISDRPTQVGEEQQTAATSSSLAKDRDLTHLLESLHMSPGDELWGADEAQAGVNDLRPQGMCKPYLIPDFVTRATQGTGSESLEREVCTQGGAQLVLRQARVRPLPEQVTLAQFLSANARIMAKLIREGRLRSQEELFGLFGVYRRCGRLCSGM